MVGRPPDGGDAAEALLRPLPRHVVRRRRGRPARRVPLRLPVADARRRGVHPLRRRRSRRGAAPGSAATSTSGSSQAVAPRTVVRAVTSPVNERSVAFHQALGFEIERVDEDYDGRGEARVLLREAPLTSDSVLPGGADDKAAGGGCRSTAGSSTRRRPSGCSGVPASARAGRGGGAREARSRRRRPLAPEPRRRAARRAEAARLEGPPARAGRCVGPRPLLVARQDGAHVAPARRADDARLARLVRDLERRASATRS